jgi:hypothetical protein
MQRTAVEAFNSLRLCDYARIDQRVTPSGEIFVIEVNPNCYWNARQSSRARRASGASRITRSLEKSSS